MPPPLRLPSDTQKLRLYAEDIDFLHAHFPRKVNEVVRELIHAYIQRLRADPRYAPTDPLDIDL